MLYYYEDLTYRDLAALLGVSTATINARLTKAHDLLHKRFRTAGVNHVAHDEALQLLAARSTGE